jgi:hypothetical protein
LICLKKQQQHIAWWKKDNIFSKWCWVIWISIRKKFLQVEQKMYLYNLTICRIFLIGIKILITKEALKYQTSSKVWSIVQSRIIFAKWKQLIPDREKTFAIQPSGEVLIFRIYKSMVKKKDRGPIDKTCHCTQKIYKSSIHKQ